jgi:hypothetical protein
MMLITVWQSGATKPSWRAECVTREQAERLADRYRAVIARRGWNQDVRITEVSP